MNNNDFPRVTSSYCNLHPPFTPLVSIVITSRNPTRPDRESKACDQSRTHRTMTDSSAFANAIAALSAAIAAIVPSPRPIDHAPILDPFESNDSFDLSSCTGFMAYRTVSSPLDDIWDGSVGTFHSFVVALRLHTSKGKWNRYTDAGILNSELRTSSLITIPSQMQKYKLHVLQMLLSVQYKV